MFDGLRGRCLNRHTPSGSHTDPALTLLLASRFRFARVAAEPVTGLSSSSRETATRSHATAPFCDHMERFGWPHTGSGLEKITLYCAAVAYM